MSELVEQQGSGASETVPMAAATKRGFLFYRHGMLGSKTKVFVSVEHGTLILFDANTWFIIHRFSLYECELRLDKKLLHVKLPLIGKHGYEVVLVGDTEEDVAGWAAAMNEHIKFSAELDVWKLKKLRDLGEGADLTEAAAAMGAHGMFKKGAKKQKKKEENDEEEQLPDLPHMKGITADTTIANIEAPVESIAGMQIYYKGDRLVAHDEDDDEEDPPICQSWLIKQGEAHSNVKLRFFSLQNGHLRYFTTDNIPVDPSILSDAGAAGAGSGATKATGARAACKARLNLFGYEVRSSPAASSIKIELIPGRESECHRHLELYCDDHATKEMWTRALREHVVFKSS